MKKRITVWVIVFLCAVLALAGSAASEKSGECGTGVTWSLLDKGLLTISGSGKITAHPWTDEETIGLVKDVSIGKGITGICDSAFEDCSKLTKVTLPDTLASIGAYAFLYCDELKEITIPDSVKEIGRYALPLYNNILVHVSSLDVGEAVSKTDNAFRMSGLKYSQKYLYADGKKTGLEISGVDKGITSFTFPEGTTVIGESAFEECTKLKSITIPEGVVKICWSAFDGCTSLAEVSLPSTLTAVENYAFIGCSALNSLTLPDQIDTVSQASFATYYGDLTLYVKTGSLTEKTISKTGLAYRETGMNYSIRKAFDDNGKENGVILDDVDSELTSFTIPEKITDIGAYAFRQCKKLQKLTIPARLTRIGENALGDFGGYVYFQGDAPEFDDNAFRDSTVIAVYPHDADGWTEAVLQKYGAETLLWRADNEEAPEDKPRDRTEDLEQEETNNESGQDVYRYSSTVDSYLTANDDGTLLRVEHVGENAVLELYSADLKLTWKQTLKLELPLWGGYFGGKDYNFLVVGDENPEESDDVEVIRVIRYSKNWHRIDSLSIKGHNTVDPFGAGSLRMSESGDFLYIHTCHRMYKSGDGKNHQANMSFQIYIPTMEITRENYLVSNDYFDYVSHSFDQHVITDGDDVIKVDHGDAYPRAVTLWKVADTAGSPGYGDTTRVTILPISGESGNNYTGVSVGGLTASASRYIVAGTSVDQSHFDTSEQKNIFIASVPKNSPEDSSVSLRWITAYGEGSGIHVATPQLVRISGTQQLLLWSETDGNGEKTLKYVFLKEDGSPSSDIQSADGRLSDCKPVIRDGKVIWYVTEDSGSVFYIIDPEDPAVLQKAARSSWVKLTAGWYYYDENGKMVTGWLPLGDKTYYMDKQGLMVTGFRKISGKRYVFADSGEMLTGQWYTDEAKQQYYLGDDGAAVTGIAAVKVAEYFHNPETDKWESRITEKKRFFNGDGVMQTGWQTAADGKTYWFDEYSGDMAAGEWHSEQNGEGTEDWYYLGDDGAMVTGLVTLPGRDYRYNPETGEYEGIETTFTYYLDPDGKRASGWRTAEDGKAYWFDESGRMQKNRWITDNGKEYFLGEDGTMQTGFVAVTEDDYVWSDEKNDWEYKKTIRSYYVDAEKGKVTGWLQVEGTYYYFDSKGVMQTGWLSGDNSAAYYLDDDGRMVTGLATVKVREYARQPETGNWEFRIVEKERFFSADGVMQTGWQTAEDGKTYYFDENSGDMVTGKWIHGQNADGTESDYYLGDDGAMAAAGDVEIDGTVYHFDESGRCTGESTGVPDTRGWLETESGWQFIGEDGAAVTGWLQDGDIWYYMDQDGIMVTGWKQISGTWYWFSAGGEMATGWEQIGGVWYWFSAGGEMATGWEQIGGVWYWFSAGGGMATGWQEIGGAWYWFSAGGGMATGWQQIDGAGYYFNASGEMTTGWQQADGKWYYSGENGKTVTGWQQIGSVWYWFSENGEMAAGWQQIGSIWYWFNDSGEMMTGWQKIGGTWYLFSTDGAMATGWKKADGEWYYFKKSGAMASNEWIEDKEAEKKLPANEKRALWYWFDVNGHMAKGWKEINGKWEMFADSGEWLYSWQAN